MSESTPFSLTLGSMVGLALGRLGIADHRKSIREQVCGAWTLVSVTSEHDDASWTNPLGLHPKGAMVFTPDGHFSVIQFSSDGAIAYYGTYTLNEAHKTFSLRVAASTFSNMAGGEQKRIVTSLTQDEL